MTRGWRLKGGLEFKFTSHRIRLNDDLSSETKTIYHLMGYHMKTWKLNFIHLSQDGRCRSIGAYSTEPPLAPPLYDSHSPLKQEPALSQITGPERHVDVLGPTWLQ